MMDSICLQYWLIHEPCHEKTNNLGFLTSPIQTELYCLYRHRSWLEARNFIFRNKGNCTICVAKTKVLITFPVTA